MDYGSCLGYLGWLVIYKCCAKTSKLILLGGSHSSSGISPDGLLSFEEISDILEVCGREKR